MYDLLLKNGTVCDPANHIFSRLHVAVRDGKIAALSDVPLEARETVDCTGLIVAPGFVDAHSHEDGPEADGSIRADITLRALRMGVTTLVGGNCGEGQPDLAAYRQAYTGKQPIHLAMLAGHTTLRHMTGVTDRYAASPASAVEQMKIILRQQLESGDVFGLSFGIRYAPGMTLEEMCPLAAIVKEYGGVVAAHIRNDAFDALDAFDEFLEIGRRTGVKLQVSHIGSMAAYGLMDRALARIDTCVAAGQDVWVDCYPYDAFSTSIGATTYDDGFLERYGNNVTKIEMTDGELKGQRIPDLDTFSRIRREHPEYLTVGHVMDQREVDLALTHPRVVVGSDGVLLNGAGHPRAAGAFPRFLRQYALEGHRLSLPEAMAKITCQPAARFGLDRGTLFPGAAADVTVFDPRTLTDRATFQEPALPPEGIRLVLISGTPALQDGRVLRADLGTMFRR